ncbi:hypothetical protein [Bradyrhizobium sp. STM 3843]|uniref:hypothetical protein n=1 Tax=Bradyrhizobium sp. STM 3843 TaxID=551947 RepID=UPI000559C082|nr:hypothetical protein [Bradyrhizobium sp. STM 3843]
MAPTAPAEPMLTPDRLRALLEASGFGSSMVVAPGRHVLSVGCSIVLQFGDEVVRDEAGVRQIKVKSSILINGDERRTDRVTRWEISRSLSAVADDERFGIALEADLLLGSVVPLEDRLLSSEEALCHLRQLIADLQATLRGLPVSDRLGEDARLPILRIEARFSGDIMVGRSGVVQAPANGRRPATPRTTAQRVRLGIATCDCLAEQVLPDILRAVRAVIGPDNRARIPLQHDADGSAWQQQVTLPETLQ